MERGQIAFRVQASGDARLVRHDKHKKARVVEQLYRFLCSFDPAEARTGADIAVIVVENAVTIEERRGPLSARRRLLLGSRIGCRRPDTDKITVKRHSNERSIPRKHRKNFFLERAAGRDVADQVAATQVDATVDLHCPKARAGRLLSQSDGRGCCRFFREADGQFEQIDVEPSIAVQQQEHIVQPVAGVPDCATGAGAFRLDQTSISRPNRAFSGVEAA